MNHADRERRLQEAEAAFRAITRQEKVERDKKTENLRAARLQHEWEVEASKPSAAPIPIASKLTRTSKALQRKQ